MTTPDDQDLELLSGAQVPRLLAECALWGGARTEARDIVGQWLATQQLVLGLGGSVGSGKTAAACRAIAATLRDPRTSARICKGRHLTAIAPWQDDRLELLCRPHLLVIDEAGGSASVEKEAPVLDQLLDERCNRMLRTIITTNMDARRFREAFGERVVSRINGHGSWREVAGRDLRGSAKPTRPEGYVTIAAARERLQLELDLEHDRRYREWVRMSDETERAERAAAAAAADAHQARLDAVLTAARLRVVGEVGP